MALNLLLSGAISMAALVVALFFLKFWRATGDTFFIYFSLAFGLEALMRIGMALGMNTALGLDDGDPLIYLIRLLSYALILVAIVRKNRKSAKRDAAARAAPVK